MEWGEGVGGEEGEGKGMTATIGHRSSCGRWWWSWVKVVKRAKGCGGEGEGEVVGGGMTGLVVKRAKKRCWQPQKGTGAAPGGRIHLIPSLPKEASHQRRERMAGKGERRW